MKKVSLFLIIAVFLLLPKFSFAQDVPCKATNTICGGQTAYDTCTPICLGTDVAYSCYQSSNPNCIGQIYCNSENSRCQQTTTTQPTPTSTPAPLKLIDFNGDGVINIYDYIIYAQKKLGK